MSHFAKVKDGIVVDVIVAEQDFIDSLPSEDGVSWIQTSYNTYGGKHYDPETNEEDGGEALRKNYATIDGEYDADRDAFIPPRPFASWNLVEETCLWAPPIQCPSLTDEQYESGMSYIWDEDEYQNDTNDPKTEGWVLFDPDDEMRG